MAASRAWQARHVPTAVAQRAQELGAKLTNDVWLSLDEEARYSLLKLTDAKRNPLKFRALLVELRLLRGPPPVTHAETVVGDPEPLPP